MAKVNPRIDMAKVQILYCTEYQHFGTYVNRRNGRTQQEWDKIVPLGGCPFV
jgi:hypothetical protein